MTDFQISAEERPCKLESEVYLIKKNQLHRDDVRQKVWNDLQEELLRPVREDHEYIKRVDERTQRLEYKFEVLQKDVSGMQDDISDVKGRMDHLESDMTEIKGMLRKAFKLEMRRGLNWQSSLF